MKLFPLAIAIALVAIVSASNVFAEEFDYYGTDETVGQTVSSYSDGGCDAGGEDDCGRGNCGVYYGIRAGALFQDRDPFRYGRQADDSNNSAAIGTETPMSIDAWGPAMDFFVGKEINDCWSAEARVGFAVLDSRDNFSFTSSGASDAQNSFWVTRIDGVQAGPPSAQGVTGGIRFYDQADGTLNYDTQWYDFGVDFVRHKCDSCDKTVDWVVGPAFAHIGQDFKYDVVGEFRGGQDRESHVAENLNNGSMASSLAGVAHDKSTAGRDSSPT